MNDPLRDHLQTSLGAAYTLERELGGGGMSRVFVAHDEALGRDVVVKVLSPGLAAGVSTERFGREIKLAAALQEPHIVPVHAAGATADGLPWYTMPLVEGESLRGRLGRGSLMVGEAVSILRDVAKALAYAHAQGVVHRDVKPENVLLSSGTAVVTDFGIAKALQASRTQAPDGPVAPAECGLTQLGTSLGTPAYMAPEQAAGDPATGHRADLYAWGVMAYELLAGRHPFADRTSPQALMAAHFGEAPVPLGRVARGVPPSLAALVERCMEKDPAKRPPSAAALLEVLDDARAAVRTGRRRATRWALAAAGAAVVALGAGAIAWRARTAGAAEPPLVAVLPFESEGQVADSTFADGLGDAVTGKLARLAGLRVIDRKSVLSVRDAAASPQRTGRLLGAEYVLRAAVRWARGADGRPRVQVSPMLVRVSDGTTRWAGEPQVVTPDDPFTVQSAIATEVADALDVALGSAARAELARAATRDTAAFAAVERGKRLWEHARIGTRPEQEAALREFERAYTRDPRYADALGWAAHVLQWMAQRGAPAVLFDSAAALAHRALAVDPGQKQAVNALAVVELQHARPDESARLIEHAARAYPSDAELQSLLGTKLFWHDGDSAGAVRTFGRAVALAPRSPEVLRAAVRGMLAIRRYDDVRDLLARWGAVEPDGIQMSLQAARLAAAVGDSAGVAVAVREFRARGGVMRPDSNMLYLMRYADDAMRRELADASPATLDAASPVDSLEYYGQKMLLFMTRGDGARARALADSGHRLAARYAGQVSGANRIGRVSRWLARFAAGRGDRAGALAALDRAAADPLLAGRQVKNEVASQTCTGARVYALLGDAEAMLPLLRRCLTMPNGMHLAQLADPEFRRYRDDPRFRVLAAARPVPVRKPE